jgi:hypothetical protein
MRRIALATYSKLPSLNDDDRLLVRALADLGVSAEPVVWDSADTDWTAFTAVVIRSCWDYQHRLAEFHGWLERLGRLGVAVWNPPALLRWNSHKGYLRDLTGAGVATVPTRWVARGTRAALSDLLDASGWQEAVVKPAVSASAQGTWRTSVASAAHDQARLDVLLAAGDVLVQRYVDAVRDPGEWSLLFFGGDYSHTVLKRPATGDFRVQWEFGGSALSAEPPMAVREDAARALAAAPGGTLYARVDGVEENSRLVLMELELIEPHLFLGWDPVAASTLARALVVRLG